MVQSLTPQLGQLVKVLKGRDLGKYAVIIGVVDHRFVWIADGDKRKFDQPKKKNLLHLQLIDALSPEVVDSLSSSGRVSNGKLRFAVTRFIERTEANAEAKGE